MKLTLVRDLTLVVTLTLLSIHVLPPARARAGTPPAETPAPAPAPVPAPKPAPSETAPGEEEPPRTPLEFDIADHRGRVVYLDFWASWCRPCKASFPWMTTLQTRFGDRGLEVIGINLDRDHEAAETFLGKAQPNFPIVFDPEGVLAQLYDLQGMPTTLLFDRSGTLRSTHIGFKESAVEVIVSEIESLLAEEAPRDIP